MHSWFLVFFFPSRMGGFIKAGSGFIEFERVLGAITMVIWANLCTTRRYVTVPSHRIPKLLPLCTVKISPPIFHLYMLQFCKRYSLSAFRGLFT